MYADSDTLNARTEKNAAHSNTKWCGNHDNFTKEWADSRRAELNKDDRISEPIRPSHSIGTHRKLAPGAQNRLQQIREGLAINKDWVRVFDHVTRTWLTGKQLLLFIHGGPGTGKTALAKAIMQAASVFNLEHRFSATSGVAGLLNNGTTIHHLLGQQGELSGAKPNVNKIRLRNGNAQVIFIDEVGASLIRNRVYRTEMYCFFFFALSRFLFFLLLTKMQYFRLAC